MIDKFEWVKLIFATIAAVAILCFTVIGVQTIWTEYVVKDYDRHLTEQVYVDAAVNQNVNLVFYKRGCPYCEVGKKAVINAAGKNQFPTFYIDVESEDGQDLVKKYQVEKAATIVQIRGGRSKRVTYGVKDRYGHYQPKRQVIKEVFND
ncbi:thioredoxin [Streptococcus equi]|uniref:thioredoxin n=1 Tax=Streptococcus equi TaxID=1336 RepID=UPI0013315763|nr:thioredoxin [Streptococcus equi]HEK9999905.1 thioredoxin [Streptococcus equi subsp. zooepidemicus]HEL0590080.1 thioredoxin [Streptococcus equi subsp. zooepidemicus]HEL0617653.1 thioredoxin [Streptococcus equi subsp. zooepidemicus]HEL0632302.1 thioredoxin [Streptococcus equi subsp. zooepidemicus]HEL0778780.1 thioredoxin [Streptococcus equi subsp. zooepidemicus]